MFAADVGHADGFSGGGGECGAGDQADFSASDAQLCADGRDFDAGKNQRDAAAIYLAAGTHALDDFLAGVTALGKTNVRGFERGFVGNYRVVEIGGEPGDAGFEAERVERGHADGSAVHGMNSCVHAVPEEREVFARGDDFGAGAAEVRMADEMASDSVNGNFGIGEFGEAFESEAASLCDDDSGLGAFHGEAAELVGQVFERDVVHYDEFIERGEGALADGSVRADKELFGERVDFEFGEDVPLRIEQERARAVVFAQGFNVVGDDGVEVAHAVGAGE